MGAEEVREEVEEEDLPKQVSLQVLFYE